MKTTPRSRRRAAADLRSASWIVAEPVRRWMREPVTTIGAEAPVREAVARMREQAIRHLPVVAGRGRLIGIVTDRDLRQVVFDAAVGGRLGDEAAGLGELPVREVMTWGVVTVTPRTDLRTAAALMRERRMGALPVVEGARLVGMLTEHDLLAALVALMRERVGHPAPATGDAGGDYDFGFVPPDADPGRNAGVPG
jgi:acetoin utilization protein AcuB